MNWYFDFGGLLLYFIATVGDYVLRSFMVAETTPTSLFSCTASSSEQESISYNNFNVGDSFGATFSIVN